MTDPRKEAIELGRSLEKGGQVDGAVRAYLRVGAVEEAARALASVKRFSDAGHLVMDALGVGPQLVGGLDAEKKKLAMKAAVCFANAGETKRAVELFIALGDPLRAAEVLERSGDPAEAARIRARLERKSGGGGSSELAGAAGRVAGQKLEHAGQLEAALDEFVKAKAFSDAARVAYKMKRYVDAARLFEEGSMPFEAAACYAEAGDMAKSLEAVVRVPRDHPKYRVAATQAIRLASDLKSLDFRLDHFLAPYVSDGPKEDRDLEAFYMLSKLYKSRDFVENARDVLQKVAAAKPGYRDVTARLAQLESEAKSTSVPYEQLVREEQQLQGGMRPRMASSAGLVDDLFPDLPDLPPPPPKIVAPPQSSKLQAAKAIPPEPATGARAIPQETPRGETRVQPKSSANPGELSEGAIIADRYKVESKIGQGGMASVYRVLDEELGESIAMKLFLQPSDDAQLLSRFKQELTLSRQLSHPNIVRLYDIGTHEGCKFITMELLQGHDLAAFMGTPMDLKRGLKYMIQACSGLAMAHERGVIHRDIKPQNFFVTNEDMLKVMDFGIAKKSSATQGMTQAGFIAGTPAYMSPEQINNFASVSHLTDIYALGIVAYEMFTGQVPFDAEEMMALLMKHLTTAPEPPRVKTPSIPEDLETVILRCLEKDPTKRVQSCRELGELFETIAITVSHMPPAQAPVRRIPEDAPTHSGPHERPAALASKAAMPAVRPPVPVPQGRPVAGPLPKVVPPPTKMQKPVPPPPIGAPPPPLAKPPPPKR